MTVGQHMKKYDDLYIYKEKKVLNSFINLNIFAGLQRFSVESMQTFMNEAPGSAGLSFINVYTGIVFVWKITQHAYTHKHTHAQMIEGVTHLLPSVNSVPGRSLCPEGG